MEEIKMDLKELEQTAKVLFASGLLPKEIQKWEQAATIIQAGAELGLPPMRALRSLNVVRGKITESADSLLARFKNDGGRATFTLLDDREAVLHLTHPNGDKHIQRFNMADAKRAGVEGAMYNKYPQAMLRSRAITAGLKSVGWSDAAGVYDDDTEAAEVAGPLPAISEAMKAELDEKLPAFEDVAKPDAAPVALIDAKGIASLMASCDEAGTTGEMFKAWLAERKVVSRKDIPAGKVAVIRKRIKDGAVRAWWEQQQGAVDPAPEEGTK
jgi:hypothetical protein